MSRLAELLTESEREPVELIKSGMHLPLKPNQKVWRGKVREVKGRRKRLGELREQDGTEGNWRNCFWWRFPMVAHLEYERGRRSFAMGTLSSSDL
ncbi:hypothetical protein Tcan_16011 [Toxocara canis]|uniref:Uncharacterized protein n=1 Tax=Toxocara canis TaxID=6265 RepID=A0A0B2VT13_TOXCA|nr:hypothetical protein Tcan_16011 [Toxocara canis]